MIMDDSEPQEMPPIEEVGEKKKRSRWFWIILIDTIIVGLAGLCFAFYLYAQHLNTAPDEFAATEFVVKPGDTAAEIASGLTQQNIIRSELLLEVIYAAFEDPTQIKAGRYVFNEPQTTLEVARTLVAGQFGNELVSITFLEGESVVMFTKRADEQLSDFDAQRFSNLAQNFEGKLFPDTYRVPADYSADDLFTLLREQHDETTQELFATASTSLSREEVVILASILEREANSKESMRTVAGVFLNRIEIGMPLQADATIEYVLETPIHELPPGQLAAELREIESPYNTYKNIGLTPTPIGNPGRQAIAAVLNPIESEYLYYITGTDGEFYYASTYNQHLINIERHLR